MKRLCNYTGLKYNKISRIEVVVVVFNIILFSGFVNCDEVLFGIFSS